MTERVDVQLPVANLLNDFVEIGRLLSEALKSGQALNAYLLAAGLNQIVEDRVRDPYSLSKVTRRFDTASPIVTRALGSAAAVTTATVGVLRGRDGKEVVQWQVELAEVVDGLADIVAGAGSERWADLRDVASKLVERSRNFDSSLGREVIRLPPCFRAFDQRPDDLRVLAQQFAERWPDRHVPLAIVGVRTSGSYLAPLQASFLRLLGYSVSPSLTIRPSQSSWGPERTILGGHIGRKGLVLVTDDPPRTGNVLAGVARDLERIGVPRENIVLVVQLLDDATGLPARLARYQNVVMPWSRWTVHERLSPSAVAQQLARFAGTESPPVVEPAPPRDHAAPAHVKALFRVHADESGPEAFVYVKGVGLGYFGEHSLAVVRAVTDYLPKVYGVAEGLLFREWLPDEQRVSILPSSERGAPAEWLARYIVARARGLPVARDTAAPLLLRGAVWHGSKFIASAFGRGAPALRPWAWRAAQRLMGSDRPSVIDGDLAPDRWFLGRGGRPVKVGFDVSTFDNSDSLELYCFDPVADVASAVASWDGDLDRVALLRLCRELRDRDIEPSRLLLHELVYLRKPHGGRPKDVLERQRARSRAVRGYLSSIFTGDLATPSKGPICAIDIDGVLETGELGFPSTNSLGCLALRALTRHGYRPILATARSLGELQERCASYKLAGGIAEHGAVFYDATTATVQSLLSSSQVADLEAVRSALEGIPDSYVDRTYAYVIHAARWDERGKAHALDPQTIRSVLTSANVQDRIVPVSARSQTDFVPRGIDKGTAVRPFAMRLGFDESRSLPLAMAIGDTASDLPLLAQAEMSFAPARARTTFAGQSVVITSRSGQGSLADAVERLIGHRPGSCQQCAGPEREPCDRLLLAALDAQGVGIIGKFRQAIAFARQLSLT
jgi:hydroxymethylpyrimidine pyrophosphatase-like HAD family hydrolase